MRALSSLAFRAIAATVAAAGATALALTLSSMTHDGAVKASHAASFETASTAHCLCGPLCRG